MSAIALLYIISCCFQNIELSLTQYLRYCLAGAGNVGGGAYWYLYAYLGFLMLLPILRKIAQNMTDADFAVLFGAHFIICSLLPVINIILPVYGVASIGLSSDFTNVLNISYTKAIFYPLLGYYIDTKVSVSEIRVSKIYLLIFISIVGILVSNACTYYEGTHGNMTFTQNYVQLFDYLTTICVFVLIKYFCDRTENLKNHPRIVEIISRIGGVTFGIYLIDPVLKKLFWEGFSACLEPYLITLFVSFAWCIFSMAFGGIITALLKKFKIFWWL